MTIKLMKRTNRNFIQLLSCCVLIQIITLFPTAALSGPSLDNLSGTSAESAEKADLNRGEVSALLKQLGTQTGSIRTIKTDFIQEKELALFTHRLILRGRIHLKKPRMIAWYVDSPVRYRVIITDRFVRQWDEDSDEISEISLTENGLFGNVINQLSIWFSGDYLSLMKDYHVKVRSSGPYVIEFTPRENSMIKKAIRSITVMFREDSRYLKRIEFRETGGDHTVITLENTLLNTTLEERDFRIKPLKTSQRPSSDLETLQTAASPEAQEF